MESASAMISPPRAAGFHIAAALVFLRAQLRVDIGDELCDVMVRLPLFQDKENSAQPVFAPGLLD